MLIEEHVLVGRWNATEIRHLAAWLIPHSFYITKSLIENILEDPFLV